MTAINLLSISDAKAQEFFLGAVQQLKNIPMIGVVIDRTIQEDGRTVITGWHLADAEDVISLSMSLAAFEQRPG